MGVFCQRWIVLYRTRKEPAAKVIVDHECKFPFGLEQEDVADDCDSILAVVALPDDYLPHSVVIDDREVEVQPPAEDED